MNRQTNDKENACNTTKGSKSELNWLLGDALPAEMARVRNLILLYRDPILKGVGNMAALMMEASLQQADKAVMSGDVVAMLAAYQDLQGYDT